MYEVELNATFLGIILEHLADTLYEIDEVGLLAVQLHLLLVNLTNVKNLTDKVEDAGSVMLNGLNVTLSVFLVIGQPAAQVAKRCHDERQRRTDIMGGIDKELHLLLVQLLVSTTAPQHGQQSQQGNSRQQIEDISQRRAVPGSTDSDGDFLDRRIDVTSHGSHLDAVIA